MSALPTRSTATTSSSRSPWRRWLATACLVLAPTCGFAAPVAPTAAQWTTLGASDWIADGRATAPRTIYVFTDPNCPYCNRLWTDARPWVDAGKVQLRHVMVGILTSTSNGKAATLLTSKSPAAALAAYERSEGFATARMIASGQVHPLEAAALKPLADIPPRVQATLDEHKALMQSLGLEATPAVVWKDDDGHLQVLQGIAPEDEARLFGPR